jgi:RND family efflux transporter MFP subunit
MNASRRTLLFAGAALAFSLIIAAGCQRSVASGNTKGAAPLPPEIPVVRAETQSMPDAIAFSGQIESVHRIEIRPRVTGPLTAIHYREGETVSAGTPLFEFDPRPYRARRDQHAAEAARAQAAEVLSQQELARAQKLRASAAISAEELERKTAEAAAAEAARRAAQASFVAAELDVEFTVVRAPVGGQVGRALLTVGNVATANASVLATLVSVDPMRVRFAIDEATLQRISTLKSNPAVKLGVTGLSRDFTGELDYIAPFVDAATGTAEVRATIRRHDGLLRDGLFARVQLLVPADASHVIVPEAAIGAEQGTRYVLVANAEGKLIQRPVTLGARFGAKRAITAGVDAGENIVIAGLQFLRPGMVIRPLMAMSKPLAQATN